MPAKSSEGRRLPSDPYASPYAKHLSDLLNQTGHGLVLNCSEVVQELDGSPYFVAPGKFRLEPELLVVVTGALNSHLLTRDTLAAKARAGDAFITNVLAAPKMGITGDADVLGKLV